MANKKLREYVKKQVKLEMSRDKNLTKEGVMDSILNHINGVLKKANDKRFTSNLDQLAKSGPDGKKAAAHLMKSFDTVDRAAEDVDNMLADLGFEK
tara:strand:- start:330 stop:617 length:288 start_codon:yes stop_codon:yes gene_type:complete